jgi:hypothetical protein
MDPYCLARNNPNLTNNERMLVKCCRLALLEFDRIRYQIGLTRT